MAQRRTPTGTTGPKRGISGRHTPVAALICTYLVALSPLSIAMVTVLGQESGTIFGLASFDIQGVARDGSAYNITLSYDATQAGNPWQGGIYGYGPIEYLERWGVKAYFFEEAERAQALASATTTGFGFANYPPGSTIGIPYEEAGGLLQDPPLTGTIKADMEFPTHVQPGIWAGQTYYVVILATIKYRAFNGMWSNVAVSGPLVLGGEEEKLTMAVSGPETVTRQTPDVTFTAHGGGKDIGKLEALKWTFRYRRVDGRWSYFDEVRTPPMSGSGSLTVNATGQPGLDSWRRRAETQGIETSLGREMAMSVAVLGQIGQRWVVESGPHNFTVFLHERVLTISGPGSITRQEAEASFLTEGNFEADRVDWYFHYLAMDGTWVLIDRARTDATGTLRIGPGKEPVDLEEWHRLAKAISEAKTGGQGEPVPLQMRASAKAYKDGELVAVSGEHGYTVIPPGALLQITGPSTVNAETERAVLSIQSLDLEGEEAGSVKWSLEYENGTQGWVSLATITRDNTSDMVIPMTGGATNIQTWINIAKARGQYSEGRTVLRIRATAQAISKSGQTLARSNEHIITAEVQAQTRIRILGLPGIDYVQVDAASGAGATSTRRMEFPMKHLKLVFRGDREVEASTDKDGYCEIPPEILTQSDPYVLEIHLSYRRSGREYFTINGDIEHTARIELTLEGNQISSGLFVGRPGHQESIRASGEMGPELRLWELDPRGKSIYGIYIHATEALEFYTDYLGENLAYQLPVKILPGVSTPTRYEWTTTGESLILINEKHQRHTSPNRPKAREYHEFSHYAMHSLYGRMPESPPGPIKDINHNGYLNPTTADSWSEGFAHFMALVIGEHYGNWWNFDRSSPGLQDPSALLVNPWNFFSLGEAAMRSLENDYLAWDCKGYFEELAVAGVLWDLYDGPGQHAQATAIRAMGVQTKYQGYDIDGDGVLNGTELMIMHLDDYVLWDYHLFDKGQDGRAFNPEGFSRFVQEKGAGDPSKAIAENLEWIDLGLFLAEYAITLHDQNHDGSLDRGEAAGLFDEGLSQRQIDSQFSKHDTDGDGRMDQGEVYVQLSGLGDDFARYDRGLDGLMDHDEFAAMARAKGLKEEEIERAFERLDGEHSPTNQIGGIQIQEFLLSLEGTRDLEEMEVPISGLAGGWVSRDDDGVSLSFAQIWSILREPHNDFHSVYRAFTQAHPGQKEEIDAIFISHGFFADKTRGNGEYDEYEPFRDEDSNGNYDQGEYYVDYPDSFDYDPAEEEVGRAANYQRPQRRSVVEIPGHAIRTGNQVPYYLVQVDPCPTPWLEGPEASIGAIPPYAVITQNQGGLVNVPVPPPQYPSRITVIPLGVESGQPLQFASIDFYEEYPESSGKGYYLEHDFRILGREPVPEETHQVFDPDPLGGRDQEPAEDGDSETEKESMLPGWLTQHLPFLLPLIRPMLPYLPDPVVPALPYILIGILLAILGLLGIARARRGKKPNGSVPL